MKKALQLASVASMIDQFNMENIELMQSLGLSVDVVADFTNPGTITRERADKLKSRLERNGIRVFDVAIPRSLNPVRIASAYRRIKRLIKREDYSLIHCHSPIGGAICRLAASGYRRRGLKVVYTAHGFHFYTGAPLKNWLIFYPIEKALSRVTDVLITINNEDYDRAKKKFTAKYTIYVPGVGIDTNNFAHNDKDEVLCKEFGLSPDDTVALSVGELNSNKNHEMVIRALSIMKQNGSLPDRFFYFIIGKGEKEKELNILVRERGVSDIVRIVGFRSDVKDFYAAADFFIFPSYREGLSVALMEAMASGLPVACSRIRGNTDLVDKEGGVFFDPADVDSIVDGISAILAMDRSRAGEHNLLKIKEFDTSIVRSRIKEVYSSLI